MSNYTISRWTNLTDERKALASMLFALLVGSFVSIFIRWSNSSSTAIVFYRLVFAVAIIAPWAMLKYREDFRALTMRGFLSSVGAGALLAVNLLAFYESISWTSVAAATTLTQVQVVVVAVGGYYLFSESMDSRSVMGVVLAFAGIGVMFLPSLLTRGALVGERPLFGNALSLLGSLAFAGYLLVGRSIRQQINLAPYIVILYTVTTGIVFGYALVNGTTLAVSAYPPREWLLFLGMAVSSGVITHVMVNFALKHLRSSSVSIVLLGFPAVSTLYAALLLGEIPDPITMVGGAVVLVGIYMTTTEAV